MLTLILAATIAQAAPASRANSAEKLRAGCLRSEVHTEADKRRVICDCIVREMKANKNVSDADLEYLAKTWAEPHKKIEPAPKEADVLEDYDEDLMESCSAKVR